MSPAAKKRRKKKAEQESRGLTAKQVGGGEPPAEIAKVIATIGEDGGSVIGAYRDPLGGNWQVMAALPIATVEPTPYQRDLSETHVARLAKAIDALDRFLDPVIAVRSDDGKYWTPNGYHRLGALRSLGAKSIVAPVVTSGAGGLKEVGGDAAVVVEGRDPAGYVAALTDLADHEGRREILVERGRARARAFTWQRTAEQTADVYRRLL